MSALEKIHTLPFGNPIYRLVILKILISGDDSGLGERLISHDAMAKYLCVSKNKMFIETKKMAEEGLIKIKKVVTVSDDGVVLFEPTRRYEISKGVLE